MNEARALRGFAAIAQETRLRIVRMLVAAGADGLSSGTIAEALGGSSPQRTSFHLKELEAAGVTQFNIYLMCGDEERIVAEYGQHIIPHFKKARATVGV